MSDPTSVSVAVRVRPLVDSEIARGCEECLETLGEVNQVVLRGDKRFSYNYVFGTEDTQTCFYETSVQHLISRLFKGYNVTILAYGQTGSGKTYSMGTCYSGEEDAGVIPRAINDIFELIEQQNDRHFEVTVSFMELYKEQLFDLLSENQNQVDIREENRGIKIANLTEVPVFNAGATLKCLQRGSAGRATGATAMNAQSSRSHAIFTITIHQQKDDDLDSAVTSKFHLVDLAGSERSKKTLATGERLKEGININKGLLALGNVISSLGDENLNKGFISYRDSKLTRLLQDSLGGNSITLMIACVSPADYNLEETLSTLRYADRARKIKNKPIINQDPRAAEIAKFKQKVQELQLELANRESGGTTCPPEHDHLQSQNAALISKMRKLADLLNEANIEAMFHLERAMVAEKSRDKMKIMLRELQVEYDHTIENLNQTVDQSTCPATFWEQLQTLKAFKLRIEDLQVVHDEHANELMDLENSARNEQQEQQAIHNGSYTDGIEDKEIDRRHDLLTEKSKHFKKQIQDLDQQLVLKEELTAKLKATADLLGSYPSTGEDAMKEMEDQISNLQRERDGLANDLKSMQGNNISSKLAEQRRKKLQELELKISTLSKKIIEQAKVIKISEQNSKKIDTLNSEILNIKREKVTLVRSMRVDNEKFRDWKKTHLQEITKLKEQNRKRQGEMVKMERLHSKQQNVMKRKCEEVAATNKRLKEALDVQKLAKERRGHNVSGVNKIQTWLAQEIELAVSLFEAKRTLEDLIDDRASLHADMVKAQEECQRGDLTDEALKSRKKQIKELLQDIDIRSSQIRDLQQKVVDSEQDKELNKKLDKVTFIDAKHAVKYLFDIATEAKRDLSNKDYKIREMEEAAQAAPQPAADQSVGKLEDQVKDLQQIEQLTMELHRRASEIEELKGKLAASDLRNKVSLYPAAVPLPSNKTKSKKKPATVVYVDQIDTEEEYESNGDDDPDWQKTPIFRRLQKFKTNDTIIVENKTKAVKRNSNGDTICTCRGKCSTRICGCKKGNSICNENCKCDHTKCENKAQGDTKKNLFECLGENSNHTSLEEAISPSFKVPG